MVASRTKNGDDRLQKGNRRRRPWILWLRNE